MGTEIERRFLVKEGFDLASLAGKVVTIEQSYLSGTGDWTIRLRRVNQSRNREDERYFVTMKKFVSSATNDEVEFEISSEDYIDMSLHTGPTLTKDRYYINHVGKIWEVDVYIDAPSDFQPICEVELENENDPFDLPDWVGQEVTGDRSFSNAALAERLTRN